MHLKLLVATIAMTAMTGCHYFHKDKPAPAPDPAPAPYQTTPAPAPDPYPAPPTVYEPAPAPYQTDTVVYEPAPDPAPYPTETVVYEPTPAPYATETVTYEPTPEPYPTETVVYEPTPEPYPTDPAPYPSETIVYETEPAPYPTEPAPYPAEPVSYPVDPYPADPGPQPGPVSDAGITLQEGACFGTCPIYTMTVYPNEFYQLDAGQFTVNPGMSTGVLPAGSFAAASAALQTANFNALPTDITQGNPAACGPQVATDLPPASVSQITIAGTRTVNYYPGCFQSPHKPAMDQLLASLRTAFQVNPLVTTNP